MLLAGDVGGTKTLLGLYEPGTPRPSPIDVRLFPTLAFSELAEIVAEFLGTTAGTRIEAACFGVAGPVRDGAAKLTNVPWVVDATQVAQRFSIPSVRLLNDLAAMGHAVSVLGADQLAVLQPGEPVATGHAAIIAPGTGLGETLLHNIDGTFVPAPSEGGHADFAPRTSREMELLASLLGHLERVSYEDVISGPGLVNIHRFIHDRHACRVVTSNAPADELPALISKSALASRCERCVESLEMFVSVLGAEAGNLGLRSVATAGLYLGGGIPPKILPALKQPPFLAAFRAKAPMQRLVETMPIAVIIEGRAGLLGAAVAAQLLAGRR